MHDLFALICIKIENMINKQIGAESIKFEFKCASSGKAQLGSFLQKLHLTSVAIVSIMCKTLCKPHS